MGAGMPALPEKLDWLDPDDADPTTGPSSKVEVEVGCSSIDRLMIRLTSD